AGLRFRVTLLRSARRRRRGPRDGICPLCAHAVLERAPAAGRADGVSGVAPRRRPPRAPGRRSRRARRAGGDGAARRAGVTAAGPAAPASSRAPRLAGYLCALAAGATWGTTGPLSTGLYRLMPATSIGFWRVLLGTVCLALWGLLFRRALFRVDPRGWLLVGAGGGFLVALFEVAYQFAIAGAGVAGAAALLYTAPVIVALLARVLLKEALTVARVLLALLVMAGVALTVTGGSNAGAEAARLGIGAGLAGGLLSALSYAGTTLLARFAVPRYGAVSVLFLEALGGIVIMGIVLTLAGHPPAPPARARAPAPGAAATLPTQVGDTSPFRRLALPTPTLLREGSGRPGPRYWKQRADYTIRAALDTATHTIAGSETIHYTNNSPDTLAYLWLQLDQNIYRAASR